MYGCKLIFVFIYSWSKQLGGKHIDLDPQASKQTIQEIDTHRGKHVGRQRQTARQTHKRRQTSEYASIYRTGIRSLDLSNAVSNQNTTDGRINRIGRSADWRKFPPDLFAINWTSNQLWDQLADHLTYHLTYHLKYRLTYHLTYHLTNHLTVIWHTIWHTILTTIWHTILQTIWQNIWHTIWHTILHVMLQATWQAIWLVLLVRWVGSIWHTILQTIWHTILHIILQTIWQNTLRMSDMPSHVGWSTTDQLTDRLTLIFILYTIWQTI